jgi:ADP-heptose:LPS heptosyltransferase
MRRLVVRPGAIGDCILALPAIQYLKPAELWLPGIVTSLFASFAEAVRPIASTGIDLLGVGDLAPSGSLIEKLRSFDSVLSWYGANRPEFRDSLLALDVSCEFHRALPPPDYRGHASDYFLDQVGAPLGGIAQLSLPPGVKRGTVVIHPFSGSPRKNWSLENYRKLASLLPCPAEWTAGPEEELPGAIRFHNLSDLARWISGAQLYIGNDSGITHLAAATGVPTLALFGPTDPETWAPRGKNVTTLKEDLMAGLGVDEVSSAAQKLLMLD